MSKKTRTKPLPAAASTALLRKELDTFEAHRSDLIASAEGKYALIFDDRILGTYTDEGDAISEGYKACGNVPFLVRQIVSVDVPASFVNNRIGF